MSLVSFNPRTYERCDIWQFVSCNKTSKFQSTHLREVRLALGHSRLLYSSSFNPRTYERCDSALEESKALSTGFNPRTYERCDQAARLSKPFLPVSIHAPTRGATKCPQSACSIRLFQSTHLREVRLMIMLSQLRRHGFQSTHLREVRRC